MSASGQTVDWRAAKDDFLRAPDCYGSPVDDCVVARGTGPRVLLMGDSTAEMWIPTFAAIAEKESLTLAVASVGGCTWQLGLRWLTVLAAKRAEDGSVPPLVAVCMSRQTDWYERVIPAFDPDIVVLAHQAFDDPSWPTQFLLPDGRILRADDAPDFEQTIMNAASSTLRTLARPGRKFVVLEPLPSPPTGFQPLDCLSLGGPESDCQFVATAGPTELENFYRGLARGGGITALDADRLVCRRWPVCDPVLGDTIVWRLPRHLTGTYARSLAPEVESLLRAQRVIGGP